MSVGACSRVFRRSLNPHMDLILLLSVTESALSFQVTMKNWDDEKTSQMLPFYFSRRAQTESETQTKINKKSSPHTSQHSLHISQRMLSG